MYKSYIFRFASTFSSPLTETFAWHDRLGALERLNPPWSPIKLVFSDNSLKENSRVTVLVPIAGFLPFYTRWQIVHQTYNPPYLFKDVLKKGPFAKWEHNHKFSSISEDETFHEDQIEIQFPYEIITKLGGKKFLSSELTRVFKYRHQITKTDLAVHKNVSPQRIAITGSSGFIGSALIPFLTTGGHNIVKVVRKPSANKNEAYWDQRNSSLEIAKLENLSAFIHIAGEGIADGKWTEGKKRAIKESRVNGTKTIVDRLLKLKNPPQCFISASAIGIYKNSLDETYDESSETDNGFLAETCKEWEAASQKLTDRGIRVVNLRIGIVLSPNGGALKKMLIPFLFGMGGILGDGKQQMSWIALEDLIRIIYFCLNNDSISGPVNCTAPHPVSNYDFTKILGKVLNRPTGFPTPLWLLKLAYGDMIDEVLLASQRVMPKKLSDFGFEFLYPELEDALRFCLGR